MECARVYVAVREAVVEDDGGGGGGRDGELQLGEGGVPIVLVRHVREVDEHRHVPVAVRRILLVVARLSHASPNSE